VAAYAISSYYFDANASDPNAIYISVAMGVVALIIIFSFLQHASSRGS